MKDKSQVILGIIGGSGLYGIDGLENVSEISIESPFGKPSDCLTVGELAGQKIVFLARHGRNHTIPPSKLNSRANIDVLKRAGCTEIISLSAVGSLRENLSPGTFIIVDQFIDRTFGRKKSFFDESIVAHVSMAEPTCRRLAKLIEKAGQDVSIQLINGGTYIVMEGPQFSTKAESKLYRAWGCDVIGMTNMPEAKLAREAEMCYSPIAMVTDYDCWRENYEEVNVSTILEVLKSNAAAAKLLLKKLIPTIGSRNSNCEAGCHTALDAAIITRAESRCPAQIAKLDAVAGRVL
ncbi:MAG: S-methyl-5'-thioadenosine phosphorylase [Rhodospirillaceae bacterium]|nr:S-methyl-5'-thioadenosine phosphorylase [Rhodospirillaceae bacterium]|tara:strand:+ start:8800 stop:9678 length:879 start_codon:yes stop_codon:yes gene_type:complete